MKIEPYVSMSPQPNEKPVFSITFSDQHSSFDIHDLTEAEIREIIKDIEDQLVSYLEVDRRLQETIHIQSGKEAES